jgi:spore coat protein U-like protein
MAGARRCGCRRALIIALLSAIGAGSAAAQSCTVTPANASYGVVNVLNGAAVGTTTTFSISCTGTANQTVRLCIEMSPGQTNSNGNRRLASGIYRLVHELYTNSSLTTIWGSWGQSVTAYPLYPYGVQYDLSLGASGSASTTQTVYGSVFANQQTSAPGSYVWTMTNAPGVGYAYKGSAPCPTGSGQALSSISTWTATINANCSVSAAPLNFGTTGSFITAAIDSTATITVQCTNSTPYSIGLDNGRNANGSQRRMVGAAGQYVSYGLYTDSGYSQAWTTTTSTTSCTGGANTCDLGTGTGSNQGVTVYGQVPPQSAPAVGTYTDTVVVTVTF